MAVRALFTVKEIYGHLALFRCFFGLLVNDLKNAHTKATTMKSPAIIFIVLSIFKKPCNYVG